MKRLKESDIGLILIDEFEKADGAVFNYFLDVLENGKIVNKQKNMMIAHSMTRGG